MDILSPLFILSVFFAGLISFFSPCLIPLLPVYVSALSGNLSTNADLELSSRKSSGSGSDTAGAGLPINWRLVAQTLIFVAGLGTTFVLLGFGAGALGSVLASRTFLVISGMIVIILGLHQTGIFHVLFLERETKLEISPNHKDGILKAYLLGLTFSFGWTPCVGPILATVLAVAGNGNQAFYGGILMLIYTLGLAVPFLLLSLFTGFLLKVFRKVNRHLPKIRILGGILIIMMGIALMTDNLNTLSTLFIPR